MRAIKVLIVLLFSVSVFAEQGFVLAEGKNLVKASNASIKIFDSGYRALCSATYISSRGHILTAAHCIRKCLKEKNLLLQEKKLAPHITVEPVDTGHLKNEYGDNPECIIGLGSNSAYAKVLAVGVGSFDFAPDLMDEKGWNTVQYLKEAGYGDEADYAILKINANTSCVQSQFQQPKINERLWALGYPAVTQRGDGFDSDGRSLFASRGTRTRGIEDIVGLRDSLIKRNYFFLNDSLERALYNFTPDEIIELWKKKFNSPDLIHGTVDMVSGNSGGGLFNRNGELVGVNVSLHTLVIPEDFEYKYYYSGATASVSLERIYRDAQRMMTERELKEALTCAEY